MLIRTEIPIDAAGIDRLLREAFKRDDEADLVRELREDGLLTLGVVATDDEGQVVGYVAFSPVDIKGEDRNWVSLAPLAVDESLRGQGFGEKLVYEGGLTVRTSYVPVYQGMAEKAFRNGTLCDHAWRRSPVDLDTILNAPMVNDPLTKYMFCSPAEGAVALVLASAKKVRELGSDAVRIASVAFRTRPEGSFEVFAPSVSVDGGGKPTQIASKAAFEMAGIGPDEVDVAQLQDTESGAEIMHMAENGFCADGDQEQWFAEGWSEIGGKLPINTDGGCLACGEPIGASGLRQVYENTVQLRGRGGERQVPNDPKVGYSHVYGAPGLSAVAILER